MVLNVIQHPNGAVSVLQHRSGAGGGRGAHQQRGGVKSTRQLWALCISYCLAIAEIAAATAIILIVSLELINWAAVDASTGDITVYYWCVFARGALHTDRRRSTRIVAGQLAPRGLRTGVCG